MDIDSGAVARVLLLGKKCCLARYEGLADQVVGRGGIVAMVVADVVGTIVGHEEVNHLLYGLELQVGRHMAESPSVRCAGPELPGCALDIGLFQVGVSG